MNSIRHIGLWTLAIGLVAAATGCAAGGSSAPKSAGYPGSSYAGANGAPSPAEDVSVASTEAAEPSAPAAGAAQKYSEGEAQKAPSPPQDRPGLGTQWGETRVSRISTVPFVRGDFNKPFAMASLFYNDEEGARAMASAAGFRRTAAQAVTMAGGVVGIGLRDESGRFLSGFVAGDKNFIVGEAGRRYTIVLKNFTNNRLECVISVDGLDVLDGQAASFTKRGYLVDPHGELEIDGFRQSLDTVAAFRFGSVRGSYAGQKHGDTRNVGVIGVALFHERGTSPWNAFEVQQRQDANPFPGQFATPPGY